MKTRQLVSNSIGLVLGWFLGEYYMHVEPAQHKTPEEIKASAVDRQSSFLKDVWMNGDEHNKWEGREGDIPKLDEGSNFVHPHHQVSSRK